MLQPSKPEPSTRRIYLQPLWPCIFWCIAEKCWSLRDHARTYQQCSSVDPSPRVHRCISRQCVNSLRIVHHVFKLFYSCDTYTGYRHNALDKHLCSTVLVSQSPVCQFTFWPT